MFLFRKEWKDKKTKTEIKKPCRKSIWLVFHINSFNGMKKMKNLNMWTVAMVKLIQIVNGREYECEVGRNYLIGESIKGDKGGYKLKHATDGIVSTIYFVSNDFFVTKEPKNIGRLLYDFDTDIVTYKKYIKTEDHEFHMTKSIGLNWEIVSNLCPKDHIVIVEYSDKKKFVHSISVSKALKFQDFKYFKNLGYEKQVFIPKSEFKTMELEVKKKRGSRSGKSNKQRKTSS